MHIMYMYKMADLMIRIMIKVGVYYIQWVFGKEYTITPVHCNGCILGDQVLVNINIHARVYSWTQEFPQATYPYNGVVNCDSEKCHSTVTATETWNIHLG